MDYWIALQRKIGNTAVVRLIQQRNQDITTVQRVQPGAHPGPAQSGITATTVGNLVVMFVPAGTTRQELAAHLAHTPQGGFVVLQRPASDLAATAIVRGFRAAYPARAGEARFAGDGFESPTGWTITTSQGTLTAYHETPRLPLRQLSEIHRTDTAVPAPAGPTAQGGPPVAGDDMDVDSDSSSTGSRSESPAPPRPTPLQDQTNAAVAGAYGAMSMHEAQILFTEVKRRGFLTTGGDIQEIPYEQIADACEDRAHHMALQLVSAGVPCRKIFAVAAAEEHVPGVGGGLYLHSETAEGGAPGAPALVAWSAHVAVAVQVEHGGAVQEMVFDPSIGPDGPITTGQWLQAMHVNLDKAARLGGSHREVVNTMRTLDAELNDDGYPEGYVSVFNLEPEIYTYPKVDPDTGDLLNEDAGPPQFTMDNALQVFLTNRPLLERR